MESSRRTFEESVNVLNSSARERCENDNKEAQTGIDKALFLVLTDKSNIGYLSGLLPSLSLQKSPPRMHWDRSGTNRPEEQGETSAW